jgi:hypothetical protein
MLWPFCAPDPLVRFSLPFVIVAAPPAASVNVAVAVPLSSPVLVQN